MRWNLPLTFLLKPLRKVSYQPRLEVDRIDEFGKQRQVFLR